MSFVSKELFQAHIYEALNLKEWSTVCFCLFGILDSDRNHLEIHRGDLDLTISIVLPPLSPILTISQLLPLQSNINNKRPFWAAVIVERDHDPNFDCVDRAHGFRSKCFFFFIAETLAPCLSPQHLSLLRMQVPFQVWSTTKLSNCLILVLPVFLRFSEYLVC